MTRATWQWPAAIGLLSAATCAAVAVGGSSTVRTLIVLAFLLLCPGLAVVRAIGVGDGWAQLSLGIALSVAIDTLVAGLLALAGVWSPTATLALLTAISIGGATLELRRLAEPEAVR